MHISFIEVFDTLEKHDKMLFGLLVCIIVISLFIAMEIFEIKLLKKKLSDTLQIIDDVVTMIEQYETENDTFKVARMAEPMTIQERIRKTDNKMQELEELIEESQKEVIEAKERFHKLSKELSLEEFMEQSEKYFDDKLQEAYDMFDDAQGDDLTLMIVDAKLNRIDAKRERTRNASTNAEAFEAMFAPV